MYETLHTVMHEWEAVLLSTRTPFCGNKRFWIKPGYGISSKEGVRNRAVLDSTFHCKKDFAILWSKSLLR